MSNFPSNASSSSSTSSYYLSTPSSPYPNPTTITLTSRTTHWVNGNELTLPRLPAPTLTARAAADATNIGILPLPAPEPSAAHAVQEGQLVDMMLLGVGAQFASPVPAIREYSEGETLVGSDDAADDADDEDSHAGSAAPSSVPHSSSCPSLTDGASAGSDGSGPRTPGRLSEAGRRGGAAPLERVRAREQEEEEAAEVERERVRRTERWLEEHSAAAVEEGGDVERSEVDEAGYDGDVEGGNEDEDEDDDADEVWEDFEERVARFVAERMF